MLHPCHSHGIAVTTAVILFYEKGLLIERCDIDPQHAAWLLLRLVNCPQAEADPLQEQLRQMAISLLCGMVHSTWNTRMALWNCNGLTTLLELLKEEASHPPPLYHIHNSLPLAPPPSFPQTN
jgi:hypothetical protein